MIDCPRSNRSGWMSFRNWGLMWRCVTWWPQEPEEFFRNEKMQMNFLIRLLLIAANLSEYDQTRNFSRQII